MNQLLSNLPLWVDVLLWTLVVTFGVGVGWIVVAFIKRKTIKVPTPYGELDAPTDSVLRKARDDHPPGDIRDTVCVGCKWCKSPAVWRDMVVFACDEHRGKLYRGGERATRVTYALGNGVRRVGSALIHPGNPLKK